MAESFSTRYGNRLLDETYRDDVACEVRLQPDPRDEGTPAVSGGISERLLARLRYLGIAYELSLLARLPDSGQVIYPEIQLVLLDDELAFIFDVVSDQALLRAVAPFRECIDRAKRDPRGWSLVVETP